tara:strand:- start:536 stop:880 length:345 start_codon:yes stop_codon:yes gene_type:complete
MATKEHLKRQNVRRVQDEPFDRYDLELELNKEFNNLDRLDEDIPTEDSVVSVIGTSAEEIKDLEGKVDRNEVGTIELPAETKRKYIDIELTTERVNLKSIRRVIDIEFEHFQLK